MRLSHTHRPSEKKTASIDRQVIIDDDLGLHLGRPFREFIVRRLVTLDRAVLIAGRDARILEKPVALIGRLTTTPPRAFTRNDFHSRAETARAFGLGNRLMFWRFCIDQGRRMTIMLC